jgi:hypothetical protein
LIALLLSVAMVASPMATPDRITWYGARCPKGVVYLGRTDTCHPYLKGEQKYYAAAGWYRYGMRPRTAIITSKTTGRTVRVLIRDFCGACRQGRSILDISPLAFIALGHDLGVGTDKVFVKYLEEGR